MSLFKYIQFSHLFTDCVCVCVYVHGDKEGLTESKW